MRRLLRIKLPRSTSSPSPPSKGRGELRNQSLVESRFRHRRSNLNTTHGYSHGYSGDQNVVLDWSTSYQAGSSRCVIEIELSNREAGLSYFSSSASGSSDDETEDEISRGRSASHKSSMDETTNLVKRTSVHGHGPQAGLSGDFTSDAINITPNNPSFTRSRSSASARQPIHLLASRTRCRVSLMNTEVMKQRTSDPITLFPAFLDLRLHFPFTSWTFTINVDLRKLGESVLLLGTLVHAVSHLESFPEVDFFPKTMSDVHYWLTTGKCLILLFLFLWLSVHARIILSLYCIMPILCLDTFIPVQEFSASTACQGAISAHAASIPDDRGQTSLTPYMGESWEQACQQGYF